MVIMSVGPARAGMIRKRDRDGQTVLGWPRTSGDDPFFDIEPVLDAKLAPHERG